MKKEYFDNGHEKKKKLLLLQIGSPEVTGTVFGQGRP